MDPYDTQRSRHLDVVEFEPPPVRPPPAVEGEHIVYESTLEAQYRASAPTVPRIPRLELVK